MDPNRPEFAPPPIPDHTLIRRIGEGAYGEVWLACNVLGTYRAIKIVRRSTFREARTYEREFHGIKQYEPISRTNDGLLDILQAGRNDAAGYYYYVMELADDAGLDAEAGEGGDAGGPIRPGRAVTSSPALEPERYAPRNLATLIRTRGRLPVAECVEIGLNLTLALGHLHRHGLIHRDIKPANIIFVQGIPKLADLGLVTGVDDTCSFVGTEGFMAPEGPTSPRADLYSLGKVLYEMGTGKDRKDFPEPVTGFGEGGSPREMTELNAVILRACAADPSERYQSAAEFHADLALLHSGRSVRWRRIVERRLTFARRAGALVGVVAALATAANFVQRLQTKEAIRLRGVAENLATTMQIRHAEGLFTRGHSPFALAHLAQVMRRDPSNRVAAERILAALAQGTFPRLAIKPFQLPSRLVLRHLQIPARLSPDGRVIVTTEADQTVRLWNTATGLESAPPIPHSAAVTCVLFSPDGSKVATACTDGTIRILDSLTGLPLVPTLEHGAAIQMLAFDASGEQLAAACEDSAARIYQATTGHLERTLIHDSPVLTLVFGPTGSWLATGTTNAVVSVWDTATGTIRHRFEAKGAAFLVASSPDGRWLAAVVRTEGEDTPWMVQVWNVGSGVPMSLPVCRGNRIYSLAFSPDSRRFVCATADNAARVWKIPTGEEHFQIRHSSLVYSAGFSSDGRKILTASVDRTARLSDAENGDPDAEPMLHDGRVIHAEFSRDGQRILTAGWQDRTLKLWDARDTHSTTHRLAHASWVVSGEFDSTGERILTVTGSSVFTAEENNVWGGGTQNQAIIWEGAQPTPKVESTLPAGTEAITAHFTQAGPLALIGRLPRPNEHSREATIWDLSTGHAIGAPIEAPSAVTCARFDDAGNRLVIGCIDGTVQLWDVGSQRPVAPPQSLHQRRLRSLRFSPDGMTFATASDDGTSIIGDSATGRLRAGPLQHDASVWRAQFNSQGNRLVTSSADFTARVFSADGTPITILRHGAAVEDADFSPDGTLVATASADFTARIWNAVTGKQVTTEPLQHAQSVLSARFSPDSRRVITTSMDGTARLWDAATGLSLAGPFRHSRWVISAAFTPDGRRVVTTSLDGTAGVWDVPIVATPIPSWIPDLAEAVAGKRIGPDGAELGVSWEAGLTLKEKAAREALSGAGADWVLRYLGDRKISTVTTSSPAMRN